MARELAERYQTDVLHFDTVQFLPDWVIRSEDEKKKITEEFLNTHDSWVIDGNYSKLFYERRMAEADIIIFLLFNRFSCFYRAYHRYIKYKNKTRPDMADGCKEKFDSEFAKWILWRGRTKRIREQYKNTILKYEKKSVVIKNQKELDGYIKSISN